MSTIKISELSEKLTMVGTEEVLINDSGTSKKFSTQRFLDVKTAAEAAQTAAEAAQTAAETAETNAETAETNAAASASAASTSASNAATSASAASTSATNASNSASSAATAQSAAESARDSALAAYDSFDDRYLGVKASAPTLDNDGDALVAGALYFDSTSQKMQLYTGSIWVDAYTTGTSFLAVASNLSDLNNAATARTNLGLGTAATTASTDYATAAQGTNADTAYGWGNHASAGYLTSETYTGTVTSVAATAGTGISISGSPITSSGTLTITNTAPDQTVSLTQGGATTISGTYPNFTISSTDTNTTYSAGSGLDLSGTTFSVEPDLRDGITHVGLDTGDFISWSNNAYTSFYVNGAEDWRMVAGGAFHADGDVIAYSATISDERLKTDIKTIDNALDMVNNMRGVTFTYKKDNKKSAGVVAQELEKIFPRAISETQLPLKADDDKEYKVVQYDQLHGVLIEAIKELTARVKELESK